MEKMSVDVGNLSPEEKDMFNLLVETVYEDVVGIGDNGTVFPGMVEPLNQLLELVPEDKQLDACETIRDIIFLASAHTLTYISRLTRQSHPGLESDLPFVA